jgi:hypothetical protein
MSKFPPMHSKLFGLLKELKTPFPIWVKRELNGCLERQNVLHILHMSGMIPIPSY